MVVTSSAASITVPLPANPAAGDLLVMFVESNGGSITSTPAGWTILSQPVSPFPTTRCSTLAHVFAAGDTAPAIGTGSSPTNAVILNYGTRDVPTAPLAQTPTEGPTVQAPAIPTWQASQVVIEWWGSRTNAAITISTNHNSPTTRFTVNNANGAILVVDYVQVAVTTAITGDNADNAAATVIGTTLGIGA